MNTMTEEDANTLRAICEALWADKFSAPNHLNAIHYFTVKYGREAMNAYADQFKAEKQGAKT